ncbi:hypothetical protein SRHO_G00211740 [Serrasalmus rhombeus]
MGSLVAQPEVVPAEFKLEGMAVNLCIVPDEVALIVGREWLMLRLGGKMERKHKSGALKSNDFNGQWSNCSQYSTQSALNALMLKRKCWSSHVFYSEDIAKLEEVVDEFHSFHTWWLAVLPFLIANDMDPAYPHMVILHRLCETLPISSASTEVSVL